MRLLKTINPENINEESLHNWQYRKAARAIVFDVEGKVGLLHVKNRNYYKLPGGGIEEGESIELALDRECEEELGMKVKVQSEVGTIVEYRDQYKLHQTSYCYVAKIASEKTTPNLLRMKNHWDLKSCGLILNRLLPYSVVGKRRTTKVSLLNRGTSVFLRSASHPATKPR